MDPETTAFHELDFFAKVKKRPGLYLIEKSFHSLRHVIFGISYAFVFCCKMKDPFVLLDGFVQWYEASAFGPVRNGYECWWNRIVYESGNSDALAFDLFYDLFENYLKEECSLALPDVE